MKYSSLKEVSLVTLILPPQMKIVPIGFQLLPAPSPPQSPAPGPVTRSWAGETIFVCNNTIGSWGEGITIGNIIITVLLYSLFYHRDPNNILSCLTLDCKDTRHRADIRQLSNIALPGVSWIWLHPVIHQHPRATHSLCTANSQRWDVQENFNSYFLSINYKDVSS